MIFTPSSIQFYNLLNIAFCAKWIIFTGKGSQSEKKMTRKETFSCESEIKIIFVVKCLYDGWYRGRSHYECELL